jgi:chorismate mutase
MFKIFALLVILLFSYSSIATSITPTELFSTINLRLSYMEDVALYKANNNKPIEDIVREAVVIEKASISAEKEGLDKQSVIDFFKSQISAAKAIQYRYRADLLNEPTTSTPRNLNTVIRPRLIKLEKKINTELAHYLQEGGTFSKKHLVLFKATLNSRYLTDTDKEALFKGLTQIQLQ